MSWFGVSAACRCPARVCRGWVQSRLGPLAAGLHTAGAQRVAHRTSHYTMLGITPAATASEVKTAFYRCSMKWHPDRNPGLNEAHKQFLKINEAYSVLGNEQKRRAYDRSLQIRTTSSGPHRSHSTAFSSSGEYSAARPTPGWQTGSSAAGGYRRPESSYARSSAGHGPRARSNFAEWERQHYQAMKAGAEEIDREAKRSGVTANYTDFQVSVFQFLELLVVFGFVFCTAWAMSGLVRTRSERTGSSHKHSHSDE